MSRWLRVAINMNSLIGKEVEAVDSTNKEILSAWKGRPALFDVVENHVILHFADGKTAYTSVVQSIKKAKDGLLEVKTKNSVYKFQISSSDDVLKKKIKNAADIIGNYSREYNGEDSEQAIQAGAESAASEIINEYYRPYYYSNELIAKIMDGARSIVISWTMFGKQIPYSDLCDAIDSLL